MGWVTVGNTILWSSFDLTKSLVWGIFYDLEEAPHPRSAAGKGGGGLSRKTNALVSFSFLLTPWVERRTLFSSVKRALSWGRKKASVNLLWKHSGMTVSEILPKLCGMNGGCSGRHHLAAACSLGQCVISELLIIQALSLLDTYSGTVPDVLF